MAEPDRSPESSDAQASEGFSRSLRLRRRRDFLYTQRVGVRGSTSAIVVIGRKVPLGRGRVGLTVSKKVGKAHERNLVKRRLRHLLRTHRGWFAARDVVIVVQPGAAALPFAELAAQLAEAFARLEQALERHKGGPRPRRARRGQGHKSRGPTLD